MYGHWLHCDPKVCEFQHGETMIYVSYNDDNPMHSRLEIAQKTINAAFGEFENALAFATRISEKQNPVFWQNAKRIFLKQRPLIVFSVRYPLESDLPIYEISWNPIFDPESGIALSEECIEEAIQIEALPEDDNFIYVKRLGAFQYEQVA